MIMFYEEKIINGALMCRTTPKGEWVEVKVTLDKSTVPIKQSTIDTAIACLEIAKESNDYAIAQCKNEVNGDYASLGYVQRNIAIDNLIKELKSTSRLKSLKESKQ